MSRDAAIRGQEVELTATFSNIAGAYTDPTDLTLSIYPPGKDPDSEDTVPADAWVYEASLTSGGSGTYADPEILVEKLSTGKYVYYFTVPSDAELDDAYDYWVGTVDTEELTSTFTFTIVAGGSIDADGVQLYENNILYLTLNNLIAGVDGSTLGEDITYYFTTTYNPLYSSLRRIRLDLGPFISEVPDETIYLAIFEASLMADTYNFTLSGVNTTFYTAARREFTTCLAELILARGLLGNSGTVERMSKTLGDLAVSRGGNLAGLNKLIDKLDSCVNQWKIAIQSGGNVSPDTSLPPNWTVKGALADDAIVTTRQWEPSSGVGDYPAANTRVSGSNTNYLTSSRKGFRAYRSFRNSSDD